jgi:cyclophilin family peptidyl-prolyl cis-trans isomerase
MSMQMTSPSLRSAALAFALVLSACGLERPSRVLTPPAQPVVGRPSDGLLQNPRLQEVVDFQVARNSEALIASLTDAEPEVRARAAFALASVMDASAGPTLLRSLEDSDAAVRRDAAFALGQFDAAMLQPVLNSATPARRRVIEMLSLLTDESNVNRLADAIQSTDAFGREQRLSRAAIEIADRLGAHLLGRFESETGTGAREQLLASAARLGGSRTLGAFLLIDTTRDADRAGVALGLASLFRRGTESDEAIARQTSNLGDPVPEVRVNAAYGFANLNDPLRWRGQLAAVREIMDGWELDEPAAEFMTIGIEGSQLVEDHPRIERFLTGAPDWRVRTKAAAALLGWENHPEERSWLIDAMSDPSHHVAINATKALTEAPPPPSWMVEIDDWIKADTDNWMVQGYLMPEFVKGGEIPYVIEWVNQFPTTEILPWTLVLEALNEASGPAVLDLYGRAARSEHRALGVPATRQLLERWNGENGEPGARTFPPSHDYFYAAMKGAFETGDPERMALVRRPLLDPVFTASRPDVVGDFEPDPERILTGPLAVDWDALAGLGRHPRLVLDTERGRIVLTLDTEEAPLTVQWMSRFASEGRFDGVPFHRVEQDFVIQGGSFSFSDQGRSVLFRMQTEATQIPYVRGTLGMARRPQRNSEGTQFFINHTMAPHLNAAYTAWGWVSEGIEVVDQIRRLDLIEHAWVVPDPT